MTPGRRVALAARLHRIQSATQARLARALTTFFREQARRVVGRFARGGKAAPSWERKIATVDTLFPADEFDALVVLVTRHLSATVTQTSDLASGLVGLSPLPPTDPKLLALLARAGHRIRRIDEETRAAIRGVLVEGAERGYSDYVIAHGSPKDGFRGLRDVVTETYRGRAENISRTENAVAAQDAAHSRYRDAGVTLVDIIDGMEPTPCGWTAHDDPDVANGSRRTLEDAEAYPIGHPRCRRLSLPILESRV